MRILAIHVLGILLAAQSPAQDVILGDFTENEDAATEAEIVEYLLALRKVPYSKIAPKDGGAIPYSSKKKAVEKDLAELKKHFHKPPPYPILMTELVAKGKPEVATRLASGEMTKPIRKPARFMLRSTPEDIGDKKKAKGATIDFVKDSTAAQRQERWSTKGALIYSFSSEVLESEEESLFESTIETWGPSISWNVVDTNAMKATDEVEELQLSFPYKLVGDTRSSGEGLRQLTITTKPYFHTDFGLNGFTIGGTASIEPTIDLWGNLTIGRYVGLFPGGAGNSWLGDLAYRVRVAPELSFDRVVDGGNHTKRSAGDNWLRAGSLAELSLKPFGEDSQFELQCAYRFFCGISGDSNWSDHLEASATYWFIKDTFGLSAKYEAGETPITKKEVDSITFGSEWKF